MRKYEYIYCYKVLIMNRFSTLNFWSLECSFLSAHFFFEALLLQGQYCDTEKEISYEG